MRKQFLVGIPKEEKWNMNWTLQFYREDKNKSTMEKTLEVMTIT